MKKVFLVLWFLASFPAISADIGNELDLMPFINNGFYASIWTGNAPWRSRFILTEIDVPKLARPEGFSKWRMDVKAFVIDYFFEKKWNGFWIGPGVEYWKSEVTRNGVKEELQTVIGTLGIGYMIPLTEKIYLNPWLAVHAPIGGERTKMVGDKEFKIKRLIPEGSVKIGFYF